MTLATLRLAYSADADDAFMFHALRAGRIEARGLRFEHVRGDTATLNALAREAGADVVAISVATYPLVADRYLMLPHGASVGRGFGPVLVARGPLGLGALAGLRIAIPGATTTAYLVLRLIEPRVVPVLVPTVPLSRTFEALDHAEVDAALLIHEGRLLYAERGYAQVVELGEWWRAQTGLPLPLGVNVIRRALGAARIAEVSHLLRESLVWALAHRGEVIAALAQEERGEPRLKEAGLLDRYLSMYANQDSALVVPDVRRAIEVLFERGRAAGLIEPGCAVEWA